MSLDDAHAELLRAYQQLEQLQSQAVQLQQALRVAELRKVQAEAVVRVLSEGRN